MQDKEFISSIQLITEKVHPTLRVGDPVCSIRHTHKGMVEVTNVGKIKKLTKRTVTIEVEDYEPKWRGGPFTCTGRYNRYGQFAFPSSKYGFSLSYRNVYVIKDRGDIVHSASKVSLESVKRFRALSEEIAEATNRAQRKQREEQEAAERTRLNKIDAFWESEGRAIWESRQIHHLPLPFEMIVLTRPESVRNNNEGQSYEVCAKVANCIMTIVADRYDWKAQEEGRPARQLVNIQISGFELRKYDGVSSPSSFSSSSYSFELGSSYQKQFVYELFGGW